jgi:hypothetical protein
MNRIDSEFITHIYKILPVALSLIGVTSSFLFYLFGSKLLVQLKRSVLGKKLYKGNSILLITQNRHLNTNLITQLKKGFN